MNKSARGFFLAILAIIAVFFLLNAFGDGFGLSMFSKDRELAFSELIDEVSADRIKTANWQGSEVSGSFKDGELYTSRVAPIGSAVGAQLINVFETNGVKVTNLPPPKSATLLPMLAVLILPIIVIVAFYYIFIKPVQKVPSTELRFSPPRGTPEERLLKLDDFLARGIISAEEHRLQRIRVLSEM